MLFISLLRNKYGINTELINVVDNSWGMWYSIYMAQKYISVNASDNHFTGEIRNIMVTLRLNKQEYEQIKKHFGGIAGLRNYGLSVIKKLEVGKDISEQYLN